MQLYNKIRACYSAYANQGGRTLILKNMLQLSAGALPVCRGAPALQNPAPRGDFVLAFARALRKGTRVLGLGLAGSSHPASVLSQRQTPLSLLCDCVVSVPSAYASFLRLPLPLCIPESFFAAASMPTRAEMEHTEFSLSLPFAFFCFLGLTLQNPSPPFAVACTLQWGVKCSLTMGASKARWGNCW